jgi:hypothetical protein
MKKLTDFNPDGMISQLEGWKRCCEFIRDNNRDWKLTREERDDECLRLLRSMSRIMAKTAKDLAEIGE